jgi:hypothetical protein
MENLIAYQKMLELTEYAYVAIRQFPKSEKYGLAADIKHQIYTILRLMVAANKKYFKKNTLQDMDIEHEVLILLKSELPFVTPRQGEGIWFVLQMAGCWTTDSWT